MPAMRPKDLALALLIIAVWGVNLAVIKVGVVGVPPLLLAEGGLRRSVSTLRLAPRHDRRLQRCEPGTQCTDIAAQGRRWIGWSIAGVSLKLGQLLMMVVGFSGEHGGAQAQGTDHQGLKMEDLHGAISRVEKGGAGDGTRRA